MDPSLSQLIILICQCPLIYPSPCVYQKWYLHGMLKLSASTWVLDRRYSSRLTVGPTSDREPIIKFDVRRCFKLVIQFLWCAQDTVSCEGNRRLINACYGVQKGHQIIPSFAPARKPLGLVFFNDCRTNSWHKRYSNHRGALACRLGSVIAHPQSSFTCQWINPTYHQYRLKSISEMVSRHSVLIRALIPPFLPGCTNHLNIY